MPEPAKSNVAVERQLSISMSLEHTEWQDRKVNLIDVPGDPAFQGELRRAARVVEEALVTMSAVMVVETIGHEGPVAAPHRDGKVTYPPLYDPPHTAQMTWIFPPRKARMMTWPPVGVKTRPQGRVDSRGVDGFTAIHPRRPRRKPRRRSRRSLSPAHHAVRWLLSIGEEKPVPLAGRSCRILL